MRTVFVASLIGVSLIVGSGAQSPAPLPDADRFFAEARKRLASNALLQSRFMFRERVTQLRLNPLGRMGTGPTEVFEIYPVEGEDMTYRRLVQRDGKPLPAAEIAAEDKKFLDKYNAWRRRLASEGQSERQARERKHAEEQARDRRRATEVMELFVFTLERRETIDNQPAIVVSFRPKPGAQPQSREARVAHSFAGLAWLHEYEHEVMRVHAEAINDVSFGWGMIARLHKGATASFKRAKIGDVWLPVETRFDGSGRALLLRRADFKFTREYYDYRPFDQSQLAATLAASSTGSN